MAHVRGRPVTASCRFHSRRWNRREGYAVTRALPSELRWQSGRLLTDRSLVRSQVVAKSFFVVGICIFIYLYFFLYPCFVFRYHMFFFFVFGACFDFRDTQIPLNIHTTPVA